MPRTYTLRQRMRYRFDNALSRGLWAVLAWLGALALVFVLAVATVIVLTGIGPSDEPTSFLEGLWLALTRSLDAGTFTGDEGTRFRLFMLLVTIIGLFLGAAIIGLVSSAIDSRVDALRRGKSIVVEHGHTLIIGHSDKLPAVVSELVEANASERGRAIVVLSSDDTVEVTEDIRAQVRDLKTSRLVVRSGVATRIPDLEQANPAEARSVVVLQGPEESDAHVVKTVLALAQIVPGLDGLTVVAELEDPDTADALRSAVGPRLLTVIPNDIIARISAQVSRAAGLGVVYQELLDFDGDEIYTAAVPEAWAGRTFGELLLASTASTIIGVRRGEEVRLCPPATDVLRPGDEAIGIAEDDSTFVLDAAPVPWAPASAGATVFTDQRQERTLIVGWSALAPLIALEIEGHVAPGSELHVMVDPDAMGDGGVDALALDRQSVHLHTGDPISRADIDAVLQRGPFDHILLLCERERYATDEADARTLLTLMLVRAATRDTADAQNILTELLEPNAVDLGGTSDGGDFIVSQKLISLLMAQLSESPHLSAVFADLLDSGGVRLALHPAQEYVPLGAATFADIVRAAREAGVVAIGYRAAAAVGAAGAMAGGVRVNPPKPDPITLGTGDSIIVLARD